MVSLKEELDGARFVLQPEEGQLAQHPPGHHTARHLNGNVPLLPLGQVAVVPLEILETVAGGKTRGIGLVAQVAQGVGFLQARGA